MIDTCPDHGSGCAVLEALLATESAPFAVLRRPDSLPGRVELLIGDVSPVVRLSDLPLPGSGGATGPRHDSLVLVPFRQVAERGLAHHDDGEQVLVLRVRRQCTVSLGEILLRLPDGPVGLTGGGFDIDDDEYARLVDDVIDNEIGAGAGSNFVIKRAFLAEIPDYSMRKSLALFRRLLTHESGAYWTFIVHTGSRTFVGATPERHVSLTGGTAVMNPISGTYRYPPSGPTVAGVLEFLTDHKEAEELYMVADEELKMMADVCDEGGWLIGPGLKQMTRLAHTEYHIEGRTTHSPAEILHRTLLAPTVTGSPLRSACQVIRRHENRGRGYYGGIIGLIGLDGRGQPSLDSAILIRTADIDPQGSISVGVGATLVRHSDAATEVAETRAKVAGILGAMGVLGAQRASGASWSSGLADHPAVRRMLSSRNTSISAFWTTRPEARDGWGSAANGRVLVVDAEDTFTGMLGQLFRSMGMAVDISGYHAVHAPPTDVDLVVVGPGPGDPRITGDAKIARLRAITSELLGTGRPFLSICLGHQVLCSLLGLPLVRLSTPNQGVQRTVELFGRPERVGFYNTFAAQWHTDRFVSAAAPGLIEVSRDPLNGQVNALRGNSFASLQFHPESLLTQNGAQILRELVAQLLPGAVAA